MMLGDAGRWVCSEVINPVAAIRIDVVHRVSSHCEYDYFRVHGYLPSSIGARAEFQKDQLFSLLEGEQGHLGTEVRDMVLAVEDRVCPILGL